MTFRRLTIAALFTALGLSAHAQAPAQTAEASGRPQSQGNASAASSAPSTRAEAYYDYTMGHIFEQQFENTSKADFATRAIEFYKKAYALDPKSPAIGERLAEMYWKA